MDNPADDFHFIPKLVNCKNIEIKVRNKCLTWKQFETNVTRLLKEQNVYIKHFNRAMKSGSINDFLKKYGNKLQRVSTDLNEHMEGAREYVREHEKAPQASFISSYLNMFSKGGRKRTGKRPHRRKTRKRTRRKRTRRKTRTRTRKRTRKRSRKRTRRKTRKRTRKRSRKRSRR